MNWIMPMEPIITKEVKESEGYIHEIKWDGIRGLLYLINGEMRVYTKKGNERTSYYPEVKIIFDKLRNEDIILDGELIVPDENGIPSFYNSLIRERVKSTKNLQYYKNNYPVNYVVFDILKYREKQLVALPLSERKNMLENIIGPIAEKNPSIKVSQIYSNGKELFEGMKQKDMEGIVSKKIDSLYLEGKKHEAWFKTKFNKKMLCIVGGIQFKDGNPNSLVLGIKKEEHEKLSFVGKASIGLRSSDFKLLKEYKNELKQKESPFYSEFIIDSEKGTELIWVTPIITCWISFLEISNNGHFRHPKIAGFTALPPKDANGRIYTE